LRPFSNLNFYRKKVNMETKLERARATEIPVHGIIHAVGETVPTDGATGYAPACIFQHIDGSGEDTLYVNVGSKTSCNFDSFEVGLQAALAAVTNGAGASLIGIEDSGGLITAATVEAALAEIAGRLNSSGTIGTGPSPLIWAGTDVVNLLTDLGSGFVFQDDFLVHTPTSDVTWQHTQVNSGTITADQTAAGGVLIFDSAGHNAAHDGIEGQLASCMVLPAAGKTIKFEARVKMSNTGQDAYFIGLAGVDTTILADSATIDDTIDKAGFYRVHAGTADKLSVISSRTSEQQIGADKATVADDTWVNLGIVINGITSVQTYVNGVLVNTESTANAIPNAVMCPTFVAKVGQTSADAELRVDWLRVTQEAR
jgi:hypothetical protein